MNFLGRTFVRNLFLRNSINFFHFGSSVPNYYQILGVTPNDSQDIIKKRFHELAKLYHPDSQHQNQDEEKFKEVLQAYKILTNENERKIYDLNLQQGQQQNNNTQQNKDRQDRQEQRYSSGNFNQRQYAQSQQQRVDKDSGDGVEEGFLNSMRNAPELYFMTGMLVVILVRWYFSLVESRRLSVDRSYPEDPEFIEERERELNQKKNRGNLIYVHPAECKQIPIQDLEEMEDSGRYNLPPLCLQRIEEFRDTQGSRIQFDIDDLKKIYKKKKQQQQNNEEQGQFASTEKNIKDETEQFKRAMIFKKIIINSDLQSINLKNLDQVLQEQKTNKTDNK